MYIVKQQYFISTLIGIVLQESIGHNMFAVTCT